MSDAFIGEIRIVPYVSPNPPAGWVFCNGQTLSVQSHQALFALLGTVYGGDGVSTFGVPNLNGRIPVIQGNGTNLTRRTMGQSGGAETVALTSSQIPPHTHTFSATSAANTTGTPGTNVVYGSQGGASYLRYLSPVPTNPAPTMTPLDPSAVSNAGSGQPHNNVMPGLGLHYIICVEPGLFPVKP